MVFTRFEGFWIEKQQIGSFLYQKCGFSLGPSLPHVVRTTQKNIFFDVVPKILLFCFSVRPYVRLSNLELSKRFGL